MNQCFILGVVITLEDFEQFLEQRRLLQTADNFLERFRFVWHFFDTFRAFWENGF